MGIITVTTAADVVDANDGVLSLREAVAQANARDGCDDIEFAAALEGATLVLTGGELVVSGDLGIDGDVTDGGPEITLSGGGGGRLLNIVGAGTDVSLNDMVLTNAVPSDYGADGTAIHLGGGNLTMNRCTVRDISVENAASLGGGIYAADGSSITISESIFANNYARYGSGAITGGSNVTVAIDGSQFLGNESFFLGGAVHLGQDGSLRVQGTQFVSNASYYSGGVIRLEQGGSLVVECSVFRDNEGGSEDSFGGAVFLEGSDATISETTFSGHRVQQGGAIAGRDSHVTLTDSTITGNTALFQYARGGGIYTYGGSLDVIRSSIEGNVVHTTDFDPTGGGGIWSRDSVLTVADSTIAGNSAIYDGDFGLATGGGIYASGSGSATIRNSTITGNLAQGPSGARGGGIYVGTAALDIANSIVAGNTVQGSSAEGRDIFGAITLSNGHNVFGSNVVGNVSGDRQNVAAGLLFAALDPATGGGLVDANGAVALADRVTNPALSGGDPLAALPVDQLGTPRPRPAISLPDIGAAESGFAPSRVASRNNDVLTGSSGGDTIDGLAGHDLIRGLGGNDLLRGADGGDLLDGGGGNDTLNGGAGFDLASFGGSTAVVLDLSGASDTARRGSETDRLIGVEGAIGSGAADIFRGDAGRNFFQGGAGKDRYTLGGDRDLVDIDVAGHSGVGSSRRDVVTDFVHLADHLDLSGIDADVTLAGNQAFRFVGAAGLGTTPGTLGYFTRWGNTIVRGSTDADRAGELQIELAGLVTLTGEDFYL
jgi:hypothetical protein